MRGLVNYLDILLLFLSLIYYIGISIYVYLKNRRALVNRVFSAATLFFSIWNFFILLAVMMVNPRLGLIFYRLSPLAVFFALAYVNYFALIYPGGKDLSPWAKILLYLVPIVFSLISISMDVTFGGYWILNLMHIYVGISLYGPLFLIYIIGLSLFILSPAFVSGFKTLRLPEKEKVKSVFLTAACFVSGAVGVLVMFYLPRLVTLRFIILGPFAPIIGVSIIAYAIQKYKMFSISPGLAYQEILDALGKSVLVYDLSGEILYAGKEYYSLAEEEKTKIIDEVVAHGLLKDYRCTAGEVPVSVSASFVREGGAVIMLFHDITEIVKEENEFKKVHIPLERRLHVRKGIREVLKSLSEETDIDEIERIMFSAKEGLDDFPKALRTLECLGSFSRQKAQLVLRVRRHKVELKTKSSEVERLSRDRDEGESKIAEFKEKIAKLRG